ncbi:MAG: L,D-transpeptidase family protein [Myxococcaceae bacterium]
MLLSIAAEPSEAWLDVERAYIRQSPSATSPVIGVLERGDRVQVAEESTAPEGWTLLYPFGAVRSRYLAAVPPEGTGEPFDYLYGRVIARSAEVRSSASSEARVVGRHARGHVLAFKPPAVGPSEWLERPDGTFLARADVKLLVGSALEGVSEPPPELAWVLRRVRVHAPDDPKGATMVLERYTALEVISIGSEVQTSRGTLPRDAVRLSHAHTRPGGIGPQERWVHVDLFEQVLTAYEGDHLVFATLVSTGKRGWETPIGIFRIWLKLRHGAMRGRRAAYLVEEVPHSLFFGEETALHGANWHDRFGTAVSHGCINLSPADAAWLFRWAPPELPEGWHGILPGPAGLQALWVHIERGDARQATAARATARSARNALTAECSRADGECRNPSRDCGVATAE